MKVYKRSRTKTTGGAIAVSLIIFVILYITITFITVVSDTTKNMLYTLQDKCATQRAFMVGMGTVYRDYVPEYFYALEQETKEEDMEAVLSDVVNSNPTIVSVSYIYGDGLYDYVSTTDFTSELSNQIRAFYMADETLEERMFLLREGNLCSVYYTYGRFDSNGDLTGIIAIQEELSTTYPYTAERFGSDEISEFIVDINGNIVTFSGTVSEDDAQENLFAYLRTVKFETNTYENFVSSYITKDEGYAIIKEDGTLKLVLYVEFDADLDYRFFAIIDFKSQFEDAMKLIALAICGSVAFVLIILFLFLFVQKKATDTDKRLAELAYKDKDYNLYNLNFLNDRLYALVSRQEFGYVYASLDIDNFKSINNIYGYDNGTKVLNILAKALTSEFEEKNGEYVFHENGDLFGVLLKKDTEEHLKERMESVYAKVRQKVFSMFSNTVYIDFRTGFCQIDKENRVSPRNIIANADFARKEIKGIYGHRFEYFGDKLQRKIEEKKEIESEMNKALENEEFQLYLQPKMNMVTGTLYGAEALVRWIRPEKGMVMPGKIIPIFENNGFIIALDFYMFEEVCKLKKRWREEGREEVIISVNMSRLHLANSDFVSNLQMIAKKYNINPAEIELELTENIFLDDNKKFIGIMERLKDVGFLLSVDDFGSGYSSLNILKDMPVDTIKLDKEFLNRCENNSKSQKIIKNVIGMIKDLKLNIVTEGVETVDQVELLVRYGCEIAQGFYYARPMPVNQFESFAIEHGNRRVRDVEFEFRDNLIDKSGKYVGVCIGEEPEFVDGVLYGEKAIRIPGGDVEKNYIKLPKEVLNEGSYTISFWLNNGEYFDWQSILYVEYDTGFMSILPMCFGGVMGYRIKDKYDQEGWYDVLYSARMKRERWYNIVISYNSKTEVSRLFVDGAPVGYRNKVPTMHEIQSIYFGADIYQKSTPITVARLKFSNDVKSLEEIKDEYTYISSKMNLK